VQLIRDLVPSASTIALLVNPANKLFTEAETRGSEKAARILDVRLLIVNASDEASIDAALATLAGQHASALLVSPDSYLMSRCRQIASLAARYGIPSVYHRRECTVAEGLMSYGPSLAEAYRQVGGYAARILNGERPADLPVQQSTRFDLVINIKTAKALGLTVPPSLLARADEVIE
jgi:putative tryptophan/tyrosine transport system substrate-binding protein